MKVRYLRSKGYKMLFSGDVISTILQWFVFVVIDSYLANKLARCQPPNKLAEEDKVLGTIKFVSLIFAQIGLLIILTLNWCNAAIATLLDCIFILVFCFAYRGHDDRVASIALVVLLAVMFLMPYYIITITQVYDTPAAVETKSHRLISYQMEDTLSYKAYHHLSHNHTIAYICEDNYSGKLDLINNEDCPSIRFCVDTDNPRIEEITYTQERIEHVITGGTISFGPEETFKEIVFYLPDGDIFTHPPALPDE